MLHSTKVPQVEAFKWFIFYSELKVKTFVVKQEFLQLIKTCPLILFSYNYLLGCNATIKLLLLAIIIACQSMINVSVTVCYCNTRLNISTGKVSKILSYRNIIIQTALGRIWTFTLTQVSKCYREANFVA